MFCYGQSLFEILTLQNVSGLKGPLVKILKIQSEVPLKG